MKIEEILARHDGLIRDGRLRDAEVLLRTCIDEALDRDDEFAAVTLYNELEGILRTTGRAKEAGEAGEKALFLIEKLGLSGTIHHGTTLLNSATAWRMAGDKDKAMALFLKAKEVLLASGGDNRYQLASLFNNISQIYQSDGRHEKALTELNEAEKIISGFPDSEAELATTWVNQSFSLMALGRREEAAEAIEKAMAYYDSPAAEGNGHYGSAMAAAGELYWRMGDTEKGVEMLEKAVHFILGRYGENDAVKTLRRNIDYMRSHSPKMT